MSKNETASGAKMHPEAPNQVKNGPKEVGATADVPEGTAAGPATKTGTTPGDVDGALRTDGTTRADGGEPQGTVQADGTLLFQGGPASPQDAEVAAYRRERQQAIDAGQEDRVDQIDFELRRLGQDPGERVRSADQGRTDAEREQAASDRRSAEQTQSSSGRRDARQK